MTADRVARLMAGILQREVEPDPDLPLSEEGGVTPMDVARLVIACERSFGVAIMDECAAAWTTLGDASAYIDGLLESGEAEKAIRDDDERTAWFYT